MTRLIAHVEIEGSTHRMGELYSNVRRGRLTSTFAYDHDYLALPVAYGIEPALPLSGGNWGLDRGLPRAFEDAAPDRWGRNLISKRLRAEAAAAGRPLSQFDDRDFLLGVGDSTRQGALRFTIEPDGEFQHPSHDVPKLFALPALLRAADRVARDGPDSMQAIKVLLDAGTGSLGGARPKASVRDDNRLMIAKFPHHGDQWNVIAWEKTALDLAAAAGVTVPATRLLDIDGHAVLLLERFDREGERRVGYISAMTLIGGDDGVASDYLEIAETLPEYSSRTMADLRELWRRIAFSIAIHNTDDHLRNHGFLRRRAGWSLAPAFDINPNPESATHRTTGIGGAVDPVGEVQVLLRSSSLFDLTDANAKLILAEVADAAADWATSAQRNGISRTEIDRFRPTLEASIGVVRTAAQRAA